VAEPGTPAAPRPPRAKPGPAARRRAREEAARRAAGLPPEAAPASRAKVGRPSGLEKRVGAMLVQLNTPVMMACAMGQRMGAPLDPMVDPLQPNEIVLLAQGLTQQAESHATFRRYLEAALAISGSAGLVSVVAAVLAVRLSAHGVLPPEVGGYAALGLQADPARVEAFLTEAAEAAGEEEPA
jgi:hypothetical protein